MKRNKQIFVALSKVACCVCAIVLCVSCLSSGTYGWYTDSAKVSGTLQIGQVAVAPQNLLTNGDFSNGLTGWTVTNPANNVVDASEGYLKMERSGSAPYIQQKIAGTYPAGTYRVSGKVKVSGEANCATAEIEIVFKNASNTNVSEPTKYTFNGDKKPAADTWTDFSFDVVIAEGETAVDLIFRAKHTLSKVGTLCYDDLSVTPAQ